MKKLIGFLVTILLLMIVYIYQDFFIDKVYYAINTIRKPEYTKTNNLYSKNRNFSYVSISDDLTPHNYQDILNIIYTTLDKRYSNITFYCPLEYTSCLNDVSLITNKTNSEELTIIGNLVNPYNNFSNISIYYDTSGKVSLNITYLYDDDMVRDTEVFINSILKNTVNDSMSTQDKIKALHDYVVTYSEYDTKYEDELKLLGEGKLPSNTAYGLYKNKLAICSGYADTLALLLDRIKVDNFKVASETHIWNVVVIDGIYYHIDATWDDPTNNILGTLEDKFFMISTEKLHEYDQESHNFNLNYYKELK